MAEAALLKQQLNIDSVRQLRHLITAVFPDFDGTGFEKKAEAGLEQLELKARVNHIIQALALFLPEGFCQTARILEQIAENWPKDSQQRNWTNYAAWPLIDYVSAYGLAYPQRAFNILEKLTPLFTAEFAIRAFINDHFDLTYQQMLLWAEHPNEHVRRLASEGLRPRLPWATQLTFLRQDPAPLWPLLEKLKSDKSLYVRRSVANNLNDISKDHPEQVMALCRRWQRDNNQTTDWIIRHGLRTLIKTGVKAVYPLLGYSDQPCVIQPSLTLSKGFLSVGETLSFFLEFESGQSQRLLVDYRIGFVRADNKLGQKVFKWKNINLVAGERCRMQKSHAFKPLSTRHYKTGTHTIEALINGEVVARTEFQLTVA
jgi:3-methyladenine DNA glycosylase AlkC